MWFDRAEAELIEAAQAGDRSAFAELLRPVYDTALRLSGALLLDADEAEDAVQEAAFTAWRRILGIVANRCRAVKRNKWWSVSRSELPEAEAPATDLASSIDLRRALRRISYDERLILVLRYYLDMPYEEIATTLAISNKAARTRVERAIHRLRPIMLLQGAMA